MLPSHDPYLMIICCRVHPNVAGTVSVYPDRVRHGKEVVDVYHSDGKGPVYVVQGILF